MSGSGEGFGPVGPGVAGAPPFAVAGPSRVTVDGSRSGSASFAVSNVSGRPVRARFMVVPGADADASWFEVVGESERALPVAATATVDVAVRVPEEAPAGSLSFVFGVSLEESPDQVVSGPTVEFEVPEREKRKFPWWIVIVAVVAVVLLAGGGILIWNLTRPGPEPTPTPTHAVHDAYEFTAFGDLSYDLDTAREVDYSVDFEIADLYFVGAFHERGFLSVVGYQNTSLVAVDTPSFEACEGAAGYTTGEPIQIDAEETTFMCVRYTDQERRALLTFSPSVPASGTQLVSAIVWERGQ